MCVCVCACVRVRVCVCVDSTYISLDFDNDGRIGESFCFWFLKHKLSFDLVMIALVMIDDSNKVALYKTSIVGKNKIKTNSMFIFNF